MQGSPRRVIKLVVFPPIDEKSLGCIRKGGTLTGNAIVPVMKVTATEHTYSWMEDNMDADLSGIIRGECSIDDSGAMLLNKIHDIAVDHVCRFV